MTTDVQIKAALHSFVDEGTPEQNRILYRIAKELAEDLRTTPGNPMTVEELESRVLAARERIAQGGGTSQESLEEAIEKW